jgi:hypothetical protein
LFEFCLSLYEFFEFKFCSSRYTFVSRQFYFTLPDFHLIVSFHLHVFFFLPSILQEASGVGRVVWEGTLSKPDAPEFFVSATQYGGPSANHLSLPFNLVAAGRLRFQAVADFLPQVAAGIEMRYRIDD